MNEYIGGIVPDKSDRLNSKKGNLEYKVFSNRELQYIFPFGKTKLNQLLQAGVLPVIKIGRAYLTNRSLINNWFEENRGKELYY